MLKWFFILSATVYFLQGIESLPSLAVQLWMKETLHMPDFTVQRLLSWVTIAWLVKPLYGYLIDSYLTKKIWIHLSVAGGIVLCILLGFLNLPSLTILIVLMALLNWTMGIRDVANDGLACVMGKETKSTGQFQSIQWASVTFAALLATIGGGYVAEHYHFQIGYIALIPLLFPLFFILRKIPDIQSKKDKPKLSQYKMLLNKDFLLISLFLWIYKTAPSFGVPLLYIKRDIFHWSAMQIAYLDAFVLGLEIIGAWLYYKLCKTLPIKKLIIFSVLLGVPTTLCYLYYTPFTAWLYGGLFGTIGMILFLVCMDFMARKSLPGLESTSFAMLCSVSNFAGWCSLQLGALTLQWWGLSTTIIISAFMGLIALPLIPYINWKDK